MKNCSLSWSGIENEQLGELFRNELITSARVITNDQFEKLQMRFNSEHDPITKAQVDVSFTKDDFEEMPAGDVLFKQAILQKVRNSQSNVINKNELTQSAIKYQVLCEFTSMVAVVKQKEKTTGETKEFKVAFGQKVN